MKRRIAVLIPLLVCCEAGPAGLVADDTADTAQTDTADTADTSETDTGEVDTGADTGADTAADTGTSDTDTAVAVEDAVAECDVPDLQTLYPGMFPASPWAAWIAAPECAEARHDAIIILGCPSESDGTASDCQRGRVEKALKFAVAGYGDRFIVTGADVANEHVEAHALRDLLVAEGVALDHIEVEPQARHTDENLYYSGLIMEAKGWDTAIVISEPEHLWYTAVCDANCCVGKGRMSAFQYHAGENGLLIEKAATYVLFPTADEVTQAECDHLEQPSKLMCTNMDERLACEDDFQL